MLTLTEKILLLFLTAIFGGGVGFWLGIIKERLNRIEKQIMDEKLNVMPTLDRIIEKAKYYPCPNIVRTGDIPVLAQNYLRLRVIIKGRKLNRLNETWETLITTTEKEMMNSSGAAVYDPNNPAQKKEFEAVHQTLVGRLEGFKNAVEKL